MSAGVPQADCTRFRLFVVASAHELIGGANGGQQVTPVSVRFNQHRAGVECAPIPIVATVSE